jgi:hypothetical protein
MAMRAEVLEEFSGIQAKEVFKIHVMKLRGGGVRSGPGEARTILLVQCALMT